MSENSNDIITGSNDSILDVMNTNNVSHSNNKENKLKKQEKINSLFLELLEENVQEHINDEYSLAEVNVTIFNEIHQLIVDTGSEVCVVSQTYLDTVINKNNNKLNLMPAQNVCLVSASGTKNKTVTKQVLLDVHFNKDLCIPIVFLIVRRLNLNILVGCDFLKQADVIINFKQELINIKCHNIAFCKKSTIKYQNVFNIKVDKLSKEEEWVRQINNIKNTLLDDDKGKVNELINIFNNNKEVFSDKPGLAKGYICKLKMKENVKLNRKSYPVPQNKISQVKKELNKMIDENIIKLGESEYINPIVVVDKPDQSVRLCLDARGINQFIVRDQTNPESIDSILIKFHKCNYMSSFDLTSGFFQVPLHEESQKYVAFSLFGRVYQFVRLPFGLCISSSEFIRCLYQILGEDVLDFCIVYVDDLAICSETLQEHIDKLTLLFKKLEAGNLRLKLSKSEFITQELKYVGYKISRFGIKVNDEKVRSILDFPECKNLKELQSFLGLCNFYRKFQKNFSYLTARFKNILSKKNKFIWGDSERKTFQEIKERFIECVMLAHPSLHRTFYLGCDASDIGLGAELYQLDENGQHQVVAYASRGLSKAELNYTVCEKECLSVLFALQKLHGYFGNNRVIVRTDHRALIFLKRCKISHGRLSRWILALQNFNIDWEHVAGRENVIPDILSRTDFDGGYESRNKNEFKMFNIVREDKYLIKLIKRIKEKQITDNWICKVRKQLNEGNLLVNKFYTEHENLIFCNKGRNQYWKLCVPDECAEELIKEIHLRQGHVGTEKTYKFLLETFYVKNCKRRVAKTIKLCRYCQFIKGHTDSDNARMNRIICRHRGHKVFIDLMGELPGGRYKWILIMLDGYTKHVKLYPLIKANARSVVSKVKAYVKEFGAPEMIISDNGRQFNCATYKNGLEELNIGARFISIFHPQSNMAERYLKEVGRILRTYIPESKHNTWDKYISYAEYIINNNFNEAIKYIPQELVQGKKLAHIIFKYVKFPSQQFLLDSSDLIKRNIAARFAKQSYSNPKNKCNSDFVKRPAKIYNVGQKVLIKNFVLSNKLKKFCSKFANKWKGPYVVKKVLLKGSYLLQHLKNSKIVKVNKKLMKEFFD